MQAVRSWFDQTRRERRDTGTTWLVIVLACVAFQALMVARLLFAGSSRDGMAYDLVQSTSGAVASTIAVVLTGMVLLWCPRQPVLTLAIIGGAYLTASAIEMRNYVTFPLLFALFRVVADSGLTFVVGSVVTTSVGMLASSWLATSTTVADEFTGQLSVAAISTLAGVGVRSVRGWRTATQQSRHNAEHARAIAHERDQALARSRIAAELHDTVGHNLTAIIALSQGLSGTTENPALDESLEGIEALAREGLSETRRAVSLLGRLEDPATPAPDHHLLHSWDDIHAVADRVRSLDIPVAVTETGQRPDSPDIADLGFTIVREALTNAVRHTEPLERAGIAIDHTTLRTRIIIRSHGHPRQADTHEPGGGLQRLSRQVTSQGGTFSAGPDELNGWVVEARLRVN